MCYKQCHCPHFDKQSIIFIIEKNVIWVNARYDGSLFEKKQKLHKSILEC